MCRCSLPEFRIKDKMVCCVSFSIAMAKREFANSLHPALAFHRCLSDSSACRQSFAWADASVFAPSPARLGIASFAWDVASPGLATVDIQMQQDCFKMRWQHWFALLGPLLSPHSHGCIGLFPSACQRTHLETSPSATDVAGFDFTLPLKSLCQSCISVI